MKATLRDGKVLEFRGPMTLADVLAEMGAQGTLGAVAAKVDGKTAELTRTIGGDCLVEPITFADAEGRDIYRHTASHILAQAVKRLYPEARLTIGPPIESGFYYDFDVDAPFTTEDLAGIEAEMRRIVEADYPIERSALPRGEAVRLAESMGEPYKVELINDLPESEEISFYSQGGFTDLCAGPHMPSTGGVAAFKLMSVAGAYWRGSERNKMLQRIYGTAFPSQAELDDYLAMVEEAKKRDHRKLGRELDLYDVLEDGPGFPFFYPKGMILKNILEGFWRDEHSKRGYQEIRTPIIMKKGLWERSGHWENYRENMYVTSIEDEDFVIKPMSCPGGILAYQRRPHSYRDLPQRMGELGAIHRNELSGTLHGLTRVRFFTQDDAHIFLTPDQIGSEIDAIYDLIEEFYGVFGFKYKVELSTRPEKSIGTDEMWEWSTEALRTALERRGVDYKVNEGDGAFYGPKIDFHLSDSIGRTWQCGTIQLDMNLPERFDLTYVGPDGERHRTVMIHRVVFGSLERFIAILTEHYAGAFPLWLSPVQAKVLTIAGRHDDYARGVCDRLRAMGLRAEADLRNEKVGLKIREAQLQKVPYMAVVGDREAESGEVSVRSRKGGDLGAMDVGRLAEALIAEVAGKS